MIKTGVPTLSELTLDFRTFIKDYYSDLKLKFVRDMVFIHSKNIIEFLQTIKTADKKEATEMCEVSVVKNLQSGYKLSMENFAKQANEILNLREKEFAINPRG